MRNRPTYYTASLDTEPAASQEVPMQRLVRDGRRPSAATSPRTAQRAPPVPVPVPVREGEASPSGDTQEDHSPTGGYSHPSPEPAFTTGESAANSSTPPSGSSSAPIYEVPPSQTLAECDVDEHGDSGTSGTHNTQPYGCGSNELDDDALAAANRVETDVYMHARKRTLQEKLEESDTSNDLPLQRDYSESPEERRTRRQRKYHSGFCCQLGITIQRLLILETREPCSFVCEIMIPILFVIGSIVLWAIFGNKRHYDTNYFNYTALQQSSAFYAAMTRTMCYNSTTTGGTPIGILADCSDVAPSLSAGDYLRCADTLSGAPEGFCAPYSTLRAGYYYWKSLLLGHAGYAPTMDQIIPLQWSNRMLYDSYGLSTIWDKTTDSAIFSSGRLYFSPDTPEVQAFVAYLNSTSVYFPYVYAGVMNISTAESTVKQRTSHDPPIWGIMQFNSFTPTDFDVSIRLNSTALPKTKRATSKNYVGGIEDDSTEMYVFSGFTTLQTLVYDYYMTYVVNMTALPAKATAVIPTPSVEYREQKFLVNGNQLAPLILVLGFLYPVSMMTKRIVTEKELRLREAMLIMGLSEAVMYLAWFIIYVVQYLVISLIIAMLLKVTYTPKSNYGILFFMFFFFCLSVISLSGLMASFFNKARMASILAPLIYFVLAIPLFAMQDSKNGARTGIMFLSPSGLAVGISIVFDHEMAGGMHAHDLTYFRDHPNMLVCLIILFVDFVIYAVLMLYIDAVMPREWGTPKHPLFFILDPIRACRGEKKNYENEKDGRAVNGVFEPVVNPENSAIRICGLCKKYGRGKHRFLAVDNFHWVMREGEISVLLGHNGAGKTTTMNMMTGMVAADAGDCYIYGYSVRRQLAATRQEIGYCPQHNILWPYLSVREHLWYYASIKGLRGEERERSIDTMLDGVDLVEKCNYPSKALSGGQKRKLSVAIAFVGGSRLVFLDEPTAGMDVGARRYTWGLLRVMSQRHSILLTTHFMDEADLLGDSIAIMSKGRLQCAGSNMFLKSKLGVGYVLIMSVIPHVNREPIETMVRSFAENAERLGSGAGEMAFRLPMASKGKFPDLLATIEREGQGMGVNGFSMSATTLEEIFINIAKGEEAGKPDQTREGPEAVNDDPVLTAEERQEREEDVKAAAAAAPSEVWNVRLMTGNREVMWSQFKAMMAKRFWNVLRDRRTQFFQIVCPVLCVLLAMLLQLVKLFQSPMIVLSSDLYDSTVEVDIGVSCATAINMSYGFQPSVHPYSLSSFTNSSAISDFQLETYYHHPTGKERYSGLVCDDTTLPIAATSITYNSSGLHEIGIATFNLYNAYFRQAVNLSANLVTKVDAMPKTEKEDEVSDAVYAMMIAIVIMIPFTFIPSTYVSWIVKERQCKARHLQNVSGLMFSMYWLTNFIFDIACYLITMFLVIIVFVIFNRKEYIGTHEIGATILLFFLYGLSGVAMAYAVSFLFTDHATGQNTVMLANFIAGFLLVLCITMLSLLDSTKTVAHVLRWIFRIVPAYCVGEGISNLAVLKMEKAFGTTKKAFSMNVTGWPMIYMAAELPFFIFVTLFVDHPGRRQRSQRLFHDPDAEPEKLEDEDEDVVAERDAVLHDPERQNDLVTVEYLRKVYKNGKVAIRNITFGVKPGEVFGFLGTNGAGKTTAISILCQEFYPTSGHAKICGNDIVKHSREALRCIGYCPQFDATLDLLTVKEHLYLYAGVRAIEYESRDRVVGGLMRLCELTDYKNTKSRDLSGGNRRKLSVALSLIGGPRVVFLDEPSAGMDPVARRGLWTAIETVADNCAVVLTTHHLEEVEALAHRVAIMVDGALQCIGNKTHLKTKFGTGFEINVRVARDTPEDRLTIENFFEEHFVGCVQREYRARRFTYELPGTTKLSETFRLMEENNTALHVTDYNVSQTTIEQVFLQISEEAERKAEVEHAAKYNKKKAKSCASCACCGKDDDDD